MSDRLTAVRSLVFVVLAIAALAACDLKPAPKGSAVAPPPAAGSAAVVAPPAINVQRVPGPPAPVPELAKPPTPVVVPTDGAAAGAGSAQPRPEINEACAKLAIHLADLLIVTGDPKDRALLEQDRTRLVLQSGISCQRNNWNEAKIKCYAAAGTRDAYDKCNQLP